MSKRFGDEGLEEQSQKKAKLILQDIQVNSIDQLLVRPSQHSSRVSLIIFLRFFFSRHFYVSKTC
jgi:hypothetical protein